MTSAVVLVSSGSPRCTEDCDMPAWYGPLILAIALLALWFLKRPK